MERNACEKASATSSPFFVLYSMKRPLSSRKQLMKEQRKDERIPPSG
jgi:hypothetical protein